MDRIKQALAKARKEREQQLASRPEPTSVQDSTAQAIVNEKKIINEHIKN